MKFPIPFCCALGVSAAFRVILTKISKRSGNAVQWNGGIIHLIKNPFCVNANDKDADQSVH